MSDTILLTRDGALARLTFNRPAFLNAMDFEMGARWQALAHELTEDDTVGAILLDANGPAFCAGGDVVAMSASGADGARITEMAHVIHDGIRTFTESDKPIVAAVQGAVAGGGLGLMLTADHIVAAPSAKFVSKYANIGLTPDLGVSTLLPAAVGQRRALQLLLTDTTIDAATALDWGLVTEVTGDPAARAAEVARTWLDGATAAFGQAKRLIRAGAHRGLAENLDDEAATIGRAFDTDAAATRIAAFAAASRKTTTKEPR
ncbi:enoyl-CoA hydratase/isomerase family protein [Microbacterium telephonicum]|uniref:Enoyl-CoA hydratase n=1 Tax=Microbacterium telephonicum TaxID=1714841 RepID=A0A498BS06_9MICO|nr:enoyl-CoA hydratase/isomerase family protein [Microbacterium telephonicum]RLK46675.1 enoyl-CoA hydratase [Microbacterium telephonicum]